MNVLEKVKSALNWDIDDEYEEEMDEVSERDERYGKERYEKYDRYERGQERGTEKASKSKKRYSANDDSKVVTLHMEDEVRVANLRLQSFEDARKVNMHLRLERTILVDVSGLDKVEGQRAIDFICGIVEAMEANIQKMPNAPIFIITPKGTAIVGDATDDFKYKGVFPWIK